MGGVGVVRQCALALCSAEASRVLLWRATGAAVNTRYVLCGFGQQLRSRPALLLFRDGRLYRPRRSQKPDPFAFPLLRHPIHGLDRYPHGLNER